MALLFDIVTKSVYNEPFANNTKLKRKKIVLYLPAHQ